MDIIQAFASSTPQNGNGDMEQLMQGVKKELVGIQEWKSTVAFT